MTSTPPVPEPAPVPPVGSAGPWAPPAAADLVTPVDTHPAGAAAGAKPPWVSRREVRAGLLLVGVLVVVGVLAGLVWLWWSPPRGIALALGAHSLLPDETEAFIAADGRYAVVTGVVGLLTGIACWCWRSVRGPALALALAVGSGAGAAVTALVGRVFGGGATGAATQQIVTPPLELRALGLLALQAAVALAVYGVSVTVSTRDDLGVDGVDDRADDDRAGVDRADERADDGRRGDDRGRGVSAGFAGGEPPPRA